MAGGGRYSPIDELMVLWVTLLRVTLPVKREAGVPTQSGEPQSSGTPVSSLAGLRLTDPMLRLSLIKQAVLITRKINKVAHYHLIIFMERVRLTFFSFRG